ncbi:MAG: phosphatase PAP2 family protein [Phenylobacterium sp.]|uniref:acid phosphatase n=1 Tax=Phenylobacterium sp. TaxID=1871053 RepID=UPI003BB5E9F7
MRRILIGLSLTGALAAAGIALAQPVAVVAPAPTSRPLPAGYLNAQTWPDAAQILPPAPATGSAREAQDQAVFKATRALEGSPRWALAQNDVPSLPGAMLTDFSCAVGVQMSPEATPRLMTMLSRMGIDASRQVSSVKDVFKRPRPYLIAGEGAICTPKSDSLAASPDYPSGHATWGWAVALFLAELAPDRATPILVRGRAFGESRVVCGVHSVSAIEAGRLNGGAILATWRGNPDFRADLETVRAELEAVRKTSAKPDAAMCKVEAEQSARTPW